MTRHDASQNGPASPGKPIEERRKEMLMTEWGATDRRAVMKLPVGARVGKLYRSLSRVSFCVLCARCGGTVYRHVRCWRLVCPPVRLFRISAACTSLRVGGRIGETAQIAGRCVPGHCSHVNVATVRVVLAWGHTSPAIGGWWCAWCWWFVQGSAAPHSRLVDAFLRERDAAVADVELVALQTEAQVGLRGTAGWPAAVEHEERVFQRRLHAHLKRNITLYLDGSGNRLSYNRSRTRSYNEV